MNWNDEKGPGTRRILPGLLPWLYRCFQFEVTHYLFQALASNGCFDGNLHRIHLLIDPGCAYCGVDVDSAASMLFDCHAWDTVRVPIAVHLGWPPDDITELFILIFLYWSPVNHIPENKWRNIIKDGNDLQFISSYGYFHFASEGRRRKEVQKNFRSY